ncbi:MAG: hypothetical protein J5694_06620 [Erysipelotrichaceae bacterium]|nr:hypothetical protein [Erysipelotrichaceae bacterium]
MDKEKNLKCPYCGSEDIMIGVRWTGGLKAIHVGLAELGLLSGTPHTVCSDVCRQCGTILRTYLKDYDYLKTQDITWDREG